MDPRHIALSVSSTDEEGRTTSFDASFDGVALSWTESVRVFNTASGQIRDLVHIPPVKSQGMSRPVHPNDPPLFQNIQMETTATFENVSPEAVNLMSGGTLEADLERERLHLREAASLRSAITGLQDEVAKHRRINAEKERFVESLEADLEIRRQNVADLSKQNENLTERNKNQSRTIAEQAAKIAVYEAGAPGVADLNQRYNELMQQVSDGADEDTDLQNERDIARKERDRAIKDLNDLRAVHNDLQDQFTDQTERLNDSQRALNTTIAARKAADKQVNQLKDAAQKRIDRHAEQLQEAEKRYQLLKKEAHDQAESLGLVLVEATQKAKDEVSAGLGLPNDPLIHKSDVYEIIDGILKRVAPEAAPSE